MSGEIPKEMQSSGYREKKKLTKAEAAAKSMPEPFLERTCLSCGEVFSLHMATVCPRCWTWPGRGKRREGLHR